MRSAGKKEGKSNKNIYGEPYDVYNSSHGTSVPPFYFQYQIIIIIPLFQEAQVNDCIIAFKKFKTEKANTSTKYVNESKANAGKDAMGSIVR